jgi:hypothetical protein
LFNGRFKPLVKLLKWWRRENKTGKRPKGFVLEVLVSKHAPVGETHYGEAFAQLLENIHAAYKTLADAGVKPWIEDPSLPGNDIMSKVSITDWKNFVERVRVHATWAREAQNADTNNERATELWRRLFGNRFKSGATSSAKAASLSGTVVAPAAAAASGGFTFPNAAAAPTTPRGFA